MDVRILGPLEVGNGDGPPVRTLGGAKQRAVLALLVLHRGEVVSIDRLVDELWGEDAPPAAAKTLQGYVSRLRKSLGAATVSTHGHGYLLELPDDDLDAAIFEAKVVRGRDAAANGRLDDAAREFDEALALWRGEPLSDLSFEPALRGEIARLDELRLSRCRR